jgi:hypothetical protein
VAIVTDICEYAILAKWLTLPELQRKLQLSLPDQQIIANVLSEIDLAAHCDLKKNLFQLIKQLPTKAIKL